MVRPVHEVEVVELSATDDVPTTVIRTRATVIGPGVALTVAVVLALLVLVVVFTGGGEDADPVSTPASAPFSASPPPDDEPAVSTTEQAQADTARAETAPTSPPSARFDLDRDSGGAVTTAVTDAGIPPPVRLLLVSDDGERGIVDIGGGGASEFRPRTGPQGEERLDADGGFVAGLSRSLGGGLTLWAGPVAGPLTPVASRVAGYAWHDTEPGVLAWTERSASGTPALALVDLGRGDRAVTLPIEEPGALHSFGDWGFAITRHGDDNQVHVVGPEGGPGFTYGGAAAGGVSRHRMLVALTNRPGGGGMVVDPDDGIGVQSALTDDGEYPIAARHSPDGWHAAVHVRVGSPTSSTEANRVEVFTPAASAVRVDDVPDATPLDWSPEGRYVGFVRQAADRPPTVIVVDVATRTVSAPRPVDVPPGRWQVTSLAFVPTSS